jgi:hypothetical protein
MKLRHLPAARARDKACARGRRGAGREAGSGRARRRNGARRAAGAGAQVRRPSPAPGLELQLRHLEHHTPPTQPKTPSSPQIRPGLVAGGAGATMSADDLKKAAADAAQTVDKGLDEASKAVRSSLAWLLGRAQEGLESGKGVVETGKVRTRRGRGRGAPGSGRQAAATYAPPRTPRHRARVRARRAPRAAVADDLARRPRRRATPPAAARRPMSPPRWTSSTNSRTRRLARSKARRGGAARVGVVGPPLPPPPRTRAPRAASRMPPPRPAPLPTPRPRRGRRVRAGAPRDRVPPRGGGDAGGVPGRAAAAVPSDDRPLPLARGAGAAAAAAAHGGSAHDAVPWGPGPGGGSRTGCGSGRTPRRAAARAPSAHRRPPAAAPPPPAQAVVSGAEQRLGTLGSRIEEYGREVEKLQVRSPAGRRECWKAAARRRCALGRPEAPGAAAAAVGRAGPAVHPSPLSRAPRGGARAVGA